MMAMLWGDIDADLSSAKRHYREALGLFGLPIFAIARAPDYLHEMAFLHAMQCGYTSFEAALKRLLVLIDEDLPQGGDTHKSLLDRARRSAEGMRPAIVDASLYRATNTLRGFRHVAIHTYDDFDLDRAALAVKAAGVFLAEIDPAIAKFRAVIDPG